MYFTIRFFIWFLLFALFITSCTEEEKTKTVEESFVSYVSNSNTSIIFGKVVLKDFIDNLQYKDLPKLNVLLSKEVTTISKGFDLNEPIYFSIDSLLQQDGSPSNLYLFFKVKNQESLADKLSSLGYLIEPNKEDLSVFGSNLSGKITSKIAVLHLSKSASKKTIAEAFKKISFDKEPHIKKMINLKSSFSFNLHLENMQLLLDKQALERPISKKEELIALYKNSFISTNFHLKEENFIGDIKFMFNYALKKRLFFKDQASKNLDEIKARDFVSGVGISIEPLKADLFISDFYPSLLSHLAQNNFTLQLALLSLGQTPISNLTDGNLAFAYHNLDLPTCKIHLGNKASEIKKLVTAYLPSINIPNLHFKENTLTNLNYIPHQKSYQKTSKHSGFYFIYNSKNDTKLRSLNNRLKFLDAISEISLKINNEGGTIRFTGKTKKIGLLHQIIEVYIEELKGMVR